jgi:hypothetical protein
MKFTKMKKKICAVMASAMCFATTLSITAYAKSSGSGNTNGDVASAVTIALPIKHCRQGEDRKEIYQGRNRKAYWRMARISDAEKFSFCQGLLARFSW